MKFPTFCFYLSFSFFTFHFSLSAFAQVNDFALWENIYLEKPVNKNTAIHLNHEGRINENASQFYYTYADVGLTYKINKHFNATLDYVFIEKQLNTKFWSARHQFYGDIGFKKNIKSWRFYLRTMVQSQVQDIFSSETGKIPSYYFRNKMTVKYNLGRYCPYLAGELYNKLSLPIIENPDKFRCFAGCFYELDKSNEIELYYLLEKQINVNNPNTNFVAGIGFAHLF